MRFIEKELVSCKTEHPAVALGEGTALSPMHVVHPKKRDFAYPSADNTLPLADKQI